MNPGRELDALIAERVFGLDYTILCEHYGPLDNPHPPKNLCDQILGKFDFEGECPKCGWVGSKTKVLPHYSTDISAAWEVVNKLSLKVGKNGSRWEAQDYWEEAVYFAEADTAPHAICLAALKAVGHSE